tara:strand:- start:523 stop:930 length:408 start_codon:yes stop_codon:yes gene_type:complete
MASARQKLIKDLDKVFSLFIRMRASDENGYATCFTCGQVKKWKEGDAGHFISRGAFSTRWNETNVQFQDKKCNIFQSGQQYLFSVALNRLHGEGTADALFAMSRQTRKYGVGELKAMIEIYKDKVEAIKRDKGLE